MPEPTASLTRLAWVSLAHLALGCTAVPDSSGLLTDSNEAPPSAERAQDAGYPTSRRANGAGIPAESLTDDEAGDDCVTSRDCPQPDHCCGCEDEFACRNGQCQAVGELCADAECCFSRFGCTADCTLDSPYAEYDGRCGEQDCDALLSRFSEAVYSEFAPHACCTDESETVLASGGVRCGADAVVLGAVEAGACVELGRTASRDASCPDGPEADPLTGLAAAGCCTEQGRCGVLRAGFGCVYEDLVAGAPCDFDADNTIPYR